MAKGTSRSRVMACKRASQSRPQQHGGHHQGEAGDGVPDDDRQALKQGKLNRHVAEADEREVPTAEVREALIASLPCRGSPTS